MTPLRQQMMETRGHGAQGSCLLPIKTKGLPVRLTDYLARVDWTGCQIREGKRGAMAPDLPAILQRLAIEPQQWHSLTTRLDSRFKHRVGGVHALATRAGHSIDSGCMASPASFSPYTQGCRLPCEKFCRSTGLMATWAFAHFGKCKGRNTMKTIIKLLTIALAISLFAGCRTAAVYNVDEASVVSSTGKQLSSEQVRGAIVRAGGGLGWVMRDAGANHIEGTLNLRKHMAQIDIQYSPKSYSINYKNSQELNYDGSTIHQNYNGWIQRLQQRIQAELSTL